MQAFFPDRAVQQSSARHTFRIGLLDPYATKIDAQAISVLIVDDDAGTRRQVVDALQQYCAYSVHAHARDRLNEQLARYPGLVIVDLGPAKKGDFELLRMVRMRCDASVIVTGPRCDETGRVMAFELGADDYIAKPYGLRELVARVRALLRRRGTKHTEQPCPPGRRGYRFKDWQLELRTRRLTDPTGKHVRLTAGEYTLLVAFLQAPGRLLTRGQLIHATRKQEDIFDRSINVQVLRLRRKLEPNPSAPRIIKTTHGSGYAFAVPVEPF
jgi:two-component system, OmpR family, response regulator